jgi:ATP-dependent metalloprotease FtsH
MRFLLIVLGGLYIVDSFIYNFAKRSYNHALSDSKKYPLSQNHYEDYVKRLNSQNITVRDSSILGFEDTYMDVLDAINRSFSNSTNGTRPSGFRIVVGPNGMRGRAFNLNQALGNMFNRDDEEEDHDTFDNFKKRQSKKSENFEVITDFPYKFSDVGGYLNVKAELAQCVDILSNYTKYTKFNIRIPRGIIFEGPPGNGKTMMAKALAGEAGIPFIPVSGSQFQEKYVGVGSSRIRELFELARQHAPVIIFIDEIDALGRARSENGESSGAERDNTLNELLVAMDGFKNNSGIFVIGATNRADLLDPALLRPGRIDKRIYIGNPDAETREAILRIHTRGKPYCAKISISDLVDMTAGLSGAQIENLMNEAMINALRCNREVISSDDIDLIMNKMMVGWQPIEHKFSRNMIDQIAIHELGHATLGLLSKHHARMTKVVINLSSPKSPAYTVFEPYSSPLYTREALFEHLTILLGGRIAEEVFYNVSITTGAINDFEEALKLAEKMVVYYGMGNKIIYPSTSEKYKAKIDDEVARLISAAYSEATYILENSKDFIIEAVEILKRDNIVRVDVLENMIHRKYRNLLNLKYNESKN